MKNLLCVDGKSAKPMLLLYLHEGKSEEISHTTVWGVYFSITLFESFIVYFDILSGYIMINYFRHFFKEFDIID